MIFIIINHRIFEQQIKSFTMIIKQFSYKNIQLRLLAIFA